MVLGEQQVAHLTFRYFKVSTHKPKWFTGTVRIDPLFKAPDPARVSGSSVSPPRARPGICIRSDRP
jgi:hypothetical protein